MNSYFRIDVNLVSAVILLLVGLIAYQRLDRSDKLNRAFFATTAIIIVQLIIEAITCLINGSPVVWHGPLSVMLHVVLFLTAPILTMYWYILLRRMIIPNDRIPVWLVLVLVIPQLLNSVIVFLSPFLGLGFEIDAANVYHRGPLFLVDSVITYLYLLLALGMIIKHNRKIVRTDLFLMVVATCLPLIGGAAQTLFYGSLLMWSSVGISLIILYMFLQQRLVHLDSLTGAWNRESYDHYITQRLKLRPEDSFGAIYFDLDQLKEINDRYGHFEGDSALKESVRVMREALRPGDIVARLGGDEFIVIADCSTPEELQGIEQSIFHSLNAYNEHSGKLYQIELSSGRALYDTGYTSIEQFVRTIDSRMYEEKRRKRAAKEGLPLTPPTKGTSHE